MGEFQQADASFVDAVEIEGMEDATRSFLPSDRLQISIASLSMSKELADQFDRDLSASESTVERARTARKQGAALDIDWETAFEVYDAQANQDPKKFIRFPDYVSESQETAVTQFHERDSVSGDDERSESTAPR